MKKQKEIDLFEDEEGKKYHFTASGGTQTICVCLGDDKNVIFELDYKNAYKMFDFLENAISFLDEDDE